MSNDEGMSKHEIRLIPTRREKHEIRMNFRFELRTSDYSRRAGIIRASDFA
jgi:hypothetical protein